MGPGRPGGAEVNRLRTLLHPTIQIASGLALEGIRLGARRDGRDAITLAATVAGWSEVCTPGKTRGCASRALVRLYPIWQVRRAERGRSEVRTPRRVQRTRPLRAWRQRAPASAAGRAGGAACAQSTPRRPGGVSWFAWPYPHAISFVVRSKT